MDIKKSSPRQPLPSPLHQPAVVSLLHTAARARAPLTRQKTARHGGWRVQSARGGGGGGTMRSLRPARLCELLVLCVAAAATGADQRRTYEG